MRKYNQQKFIYFHFVQSRKLFETYYNYTSFLKSVGIFGETPAIIVEVEIMLISHSNIMFN